MDEITDRDFINLALKEEKRLAWATKMRQYAEQHLTQEANLAELQKQAGEVSVQLDALRATIVAERQQAESELQQTKDLALQALQSQEAAWDAVLAQKQAEATSLQERIEARQSDLDQAKTELEAYRVRALAAKQEIEQDLEALRLEQANLRARLTAAVS